MAYEAAGWVLDAELGPVHGFWSVLMRWPHEGTPPKLVGTTPALADLPLGEQRIAA